MMKAIKWWFTFDAYDIACLIAIGIGLCIYAVPFIILFIISWVMYGNPFS